MIQLSKILILFIFIGCSVQRNIPLKNSMLDKCLEEVSFSGVKTNKGFFFYNNSILYYKNKKYDKIVLIDFKKENFKSEN